MLNELAGVRVEARVKYNVSLMPRPMHRLIVQAESLRVDLTSTRRDASSMQLLGSSLHKKRHWSESEADFEIKRRRPSRWRRPTGRSVCPR